MVKEKPNWLLRGAIGFTFIWLGFWIAVIAYRYGCQLFNLEFYTQINLNEAGDFFAGVFAPVAFGWLILGYFLQQKELRQNTEALVLQHKETRKLVRANKDMVEMNENRVLPNLEFKNLLPVERKKDHTVRFENSGGTIFNVKIVGICEDEDQNYSDIHIKINQTYTMNQASIRITKTIRRDDTGTIEFRNPPANFKKINYSISYTSELHDNKVLEFNFEDDKLVLNSKP